MKFHGQNKYKHSITDVHLKKISRGPTELKPKIIGAIYKMSGMVIYSSKFIRSITLNSLILTTNL